jgi:hypothetical protein
MVGGVVGFAVVAAEGGENPLRVAELGGGEEQASVMIVTSGGELPRIPFVGSTKRAVCRTLRLSVAYSPYFVHRGGYKRCYDKASSWPLREHVLFMHPSPSD